jgi:nuclear pore complex protein Nup107
VEEYYSKYLTSFGRVPASAEKFPIFNSTGFHSKGSSLSDDDTILPRIIDSLAAAKVLQPESGQALRVIQGALISNRIEGLVEELHRQFKLIKEDPKADISNSIYKIEVTDTQALRVIVHIILILQYFKSAFTEDSPHLEHAESLIAAYIQFLLSIGKTELIPLYAGRLTSDKAIEVMGSILMNVKDETRLELLKLMRMHNIDVEGCLKKTMDLCLEETEERHTKNSRCMIRLEGLKGDTGLHNDIEEEDELLIRGLEWLMLGGDALKSEVIKKGVVVYKRFFGKFC